MNRHIFLFGGGPPFTPKMARLFKNFTNNGPIAILYVDRVGVEQYIPIYQQGLAYDDGVTPFSLLPLPNTPLEKIAECLNQSGGIIIGGGDTSEYAAYIVDTPIADLIKARYKQGVPIAGFSAGALISLSHCIMSPNDNPNQTFQVRNGLGLLSDILIAVHFSQWQEEDHLKNIAQAFPNYHHYGMDEATCIYFKNEQLTQLEGQGIYQLTKGKLQRLRSTIND
ncbi:Type 1 glutamine amidotransferase-like domain-containing protein [Virgibacillus soli]|uniref:Type 1 glutamine amidotransferase-like domain-containing protein n=1 Tax=Paracerasibacillus soli TaxID=480284 RepID=A0ABU5CQL5_9BACI|nr:Type 1 glutamine amidotransferase-like domain-containing protein [Virgibacillus soli]MDY0407738.1 Type 1 glutamine amidotransferase-like domain-containing protein [Virgibacillus soli]